MQNSVHVSVEECVHLWRRVLVASRHIEDDARAACRGLKLRVWDGRSLELGYECEAEGCSAGKTLQNKESPSRRRRDRQSMKFISAKYLKKGKH
jgi:hypothetical protein